MKPVFHAASVWYEGNEPFITFVSLSRSLIVGADGAGRKVEDAACREALATESGDRDVPDDERFDIPVLTGQSFTYSAKHLFNARELKAHRHALRRGEVIAL